MTSSAPGGNLTQEESQARHMWSGLLAQQGDATRLLLILLCTGVSHTSSPSLDLMEGQCPMPGG